MKYFFTIGIIFIVSGVLQAQDIDRRNSIQNWSKLAQVDFIKSNDGYAEIYLPEFSKAIESSEGEEITLQGYIVPNDGLFSAEEFIISSLPLAQCFFCGGDSGPESVAYVYPKDPVKYTAKLVTIKGTLKLNRTDSNNLLYMINDATVEEAN
ncbi:MAG: hypothetical protein WBA74_27315 [Cyclobacteriaceae bacterium]